MSEPTYLDKDYTIALIINGVTSNPLKANHWSIQLVDTTYTQELICFCKYHVVGFPGNFTYRAEMDYNLAYSRYFYSICSVITVLIWIFCFLQECSASEKAWDFEALPVKCVPSGYPRSTN